MTLEFERFCPPGQCPSPYKNRKSDHISRVVAALDKETQAMTVRAKFRVVQLQTHDGRSGEVLLKPVYSEDPNHENKAFWDATPNGEIKMSIQNPAAFARFAGALGREFYIDFTPAEEDTP